MRSVFFVKKVSQVSPTSSLLKRTTRYNRAVALVEPRDTITR